MDKENVVEEKKTSPNERIHELRNGEHANAHDVGDDDDDDAVDDDTFYISRHRVRKAIHSPLCVLVLVYIVQSILQIVDL